MTAERDRLLLHIRRIAGIVVAVPILVTFRVICAHVEALAPIGAFLGQKNGTPEA